MTKKTYDFYLGIDVSKNTLDVAFSDQTKVLQYTNDVRGFKKLVGRLSNKSSVLIVMEASGGYETKVTKYLQQVGYSVAIVNATRVRRFAEASGKLAKTDGVDAKVILGFGQIFSPRPNALMTESEENLEELERRRGQLQKILTIEKQHLEHASAGMRKRIEKHIEQLEKELKKIKSCQEKEIQKIPEMEEKVSRLEGITGVGKQTAMQVMIQLPELGRMTGKEVSALVGVAPFNRESGKRDSRRSIRGGRASVRSALYMAALCGKRFNTTLRIFYERLIAKGKSKKVAIVACIRKLVIIMNAMIRDGSTWQTNLSTI